MSSTVPRILPVVCCARSGGDTNHGDTSERRKAMKAV
jgi:hypothetical protein